MPLLDISPNTNSCAAGTLQFYRDSKDPSTGFQVDSSGNVTTPGTITAGVLSPSSITLTEATAATAAINTQVTGDTTARFTVGADGKLNWGPGNGAQDADLYRYAANALATDGAFKLASNNALLFGAAGDTSIARAAAGQLQVTLPGTPHGVLYGVDGNVLIGGTTALGDNGVGELQLTNATTVPTTNPTGGVSLYANGGAPYMRDPNGAVFPLMRSAEPSAPVTGGIAETVRRFNVSGTLTPASGSLYIAAVFLPAGTSVGHIGFVTDTTAATGPTHWWVALLDNTYKQQAHSADQTTAAIAASTWFSLALTAPFTTTYSGTYYLALAIATSTTQPTICASGAVPRPAMITGTNVVAPLVSGVSSTGLTTPGTDGTTTYIAPTAGTNTPYLYAAA